MTDTEMGGEVQGTERRRKRGRQRRPGNQSTLTISPDLADRIEVLAVDRTARFGFTVSRQQILELAVSSLEGKAAS